MSLPPDNSSSRPSTSRANASESLNAATIPMASTAVAAAGCDNAGTPGDNTSRMIRASAVVTRQARNASTSASAPYESSRMRRFHDMRPLEIGRV